MFHRNARTPVFKLACSFSFSESQTVSIFSKEMNTHFLLGNRAMYRAHLTMKKTNKQAMMGNYETECMYIKVTYGS